MKKDNLSVFVRYILILILMVLLTIVGATLERSWRMTPEAHINLALNFIGTNQPDKALPHLIMANKSKYPSVRLLASFKLAQIYRNGTKNMPANMKKAVYYYEQAAALKMPQAQYELALLYDVGDKIPENRDKAINLMMEAAKFMPKAKYVLAVWIERGYFGPPNQAWAVALYEQAADAGIQNAMKSLISIYHGGYGRFPENIRLEQYWRGRLESVK